MSSSNIYLLKFEDMFMFVKSQVSRTYLAKYLFKNYKNDTKGASNDVILPVFDDSFDQVFAINRSL